MLRFILGRGGTGKTALIYKKICELAGENSKIMLIVPDQSSFETEKAFLDLLGAKQSKKVLVFGFSRLCRYVFDKTLNSHKNVIDNGTRAVIMSLALEQLSEKLTLLKSRRQQSLVDVMLRTVTDLKKSSVSADALRLCAESIEDSTLKTKLIETALASDTFDALVAQSYIDPLDDLTRLYNILLHNDIFSGYSLFFDGFSGFTAQQLKVIRLLMTQCAETYFSLTLDPFSDGSEEVFATSVRTCKALKDFARRDGIEIKAPIKTEKPTRFKSDELKTLEGGAYRNDYTPCEDVPKDIMLCSASDVYSECELVARQIKRLVIEEGYLYSDISVICHDTAPYSGILNEALLRYDIPFFMDIKADAAVKPAVRLVNSVFRAVIDGFERDDLISLLKTGLTQSSPDEISIFENYAFVWDITKSGFKSEFTQNPSGFSESFTECDEQNLKIAETVRRRIIEPLTEFKNGAKDKTGGEISLLLYKLLEKLGAPDALRKMYDNFERASERQTGAQQIRIWNMLMEILDKNAAATGSTPLSLARYYELLSLQLSAIQLSEIPQTIDSVTVTTAQRVRVSKQRASFLIGCTDGDFPAAPHTGGIFSPFELKLLSLNDISVSEDFGDIASLETFMAYCCMTSPSEKLYISYPISDLQGNKRVPSSIVTETVKVFPNILMRDDMEFDSRRESMLALKPAFEEYSRSLCGGQGGLYGLSEIFEQDGDYSQKLDAIRRARDNRPFAIEKTENAEALFGENLSVSASRIEKFYMCRFSYFCSYGLKIRERRRAEINPMEYGTLVHYILEKFFTTYKKSEYSEMSEGDIADFAEKTLEDYTQNYFGGSESKSRSFMYRLSALKSNVTILLCHIAEEMAQSDFEAVDCELKIGGDIPAYTLSLENGRSVTIYGSVDRVDIMKKNGESYLRVIDYKTGPKTFKLSDILYGVNLQMLLYLYSIEKNGTERYGKVIPSGILYMPSTVPVISGDRDAEEEKVRAEVDKSLKMNGLLLDNCEVIHGMDKSDSGRYIPAKIKLGAPVSARSLATLEDFGKIFKKIDLLVAKMGEELYSGKIPASPVRGAHDGCKYCPYDSVCAYRRGEGVNTFDVDNDEVLRRIDEETADERGDA